VRRRSSRIGAPRLFKPKNCLLGARLEQMDDANTEIPIADEGIMGAEPNRLFLKRDHLLDRSGVKLALSKSSD